MKKKTIIGITGIVVVVLVIVGLGPIIVARIMKKVTSKKEEIKKEVRTRPLLLEVKGKISFEKEGDIQWLILTSEVGKRYILIGKKTEELENKLDKTIKVIGKIKHPMPEIINGKPIRFIINVSTFEIIE